MAEPCRGAFPWLTPHAADPLLGTGGYSSRSTHRIFLCCKFQELALAVDDTKKWDKWIVKLWLGIFIWSQSTWPGENVQLWLICSLDQINNFKPWTVRTICWSGSQENDAYSYDSLFHLMKWWKQTKHHARAQLSFDELSKLKQKIRCHRHNLKKSTWNWKQRKTNQTQEIIQR